MKFLFTLIGLIVVIDLALLVAPMVMDRVIAAATSNFFAFEKGVSK